MLLNSPTVFKRISIAIFSIFLITNCGKNYFEGFGLQTTDNALYWAARGYVRTADYNDAILSCQSISASALTQEDVAFTCASAFAGRCGYTLGWFIPPTHTLTPPIFQYMFQQLTNTTVGMATDCDTAETILQGIGSSSVRSPDTNMFMALLAVYKIGVIVNNIADSAPDDGVLDGGFDACAMPLATQKLIGSALWDLNDSLTNNSSALLAPVKTAVGLLCTALGTLASNENFCLGASATTLTANQLKGVMSTIKEGLAFGVNQAGCGGQDVTHGACNCP